MTRKFIAFNENITVKQAIFLLRKGEKPFILHFVYLTDKDNVFTGLLSLRDLLISAPNQKLSTVKRKKSFYVSTSTHKNEVYSIMAKYDLAAVPVVGQDSRIKGIINVPVNTAIQPPILAKTLFPTAPITSAI